MPRKPDASTVIQHEVITRGVPYLLHFTQTRNLSPIMEHGLLPRTALHATEEFTAWASDADRLDGRDDAISISISAVDARMFSGKMHRSGHQHWVVLLLDPCILWTHRCRFLRRNAASKKMVSHRGRLDGPWAFSQMFSDPPNERPLTFKGESYREETGFPDYLPTYPDAEVQVLQPIQRELIGGAWVSRMEFAEPVQAELNKLPGPERTTWVRPFETISNGFDTSGWVVLNTGQR